MEFAFFALLAAVSVLGGWGMAGMAAALLHETAHVAAALMKGYAPEKIRFCASGVCMTIPERAKCASIFAAGPAANIIAAVIVLPFLPDFSAANLALAVINMFPAPPLDGGEIFLMAAAKRFAPEKADKITLAVSLCALVPLLTLGIYILIISKGNFSLLVICLWLFAVIYKNYI